MKIFRIRNAKWLKWWLIIIALLAMLLITTPVFAEGEDPAVGDAPAVESEAPTVEETMPPAPEEEPVDATPTEEVILEESPPEESSPEETAGEEPAEEAPGESPVGEPEPPVEEVPADEPREPAEEETSAVEEPTAAEPDSEVELVNSEGEALDLASQETAELLVSGDPYYSIGAITYQFYADPGMCGGAMYCFDNQGSNVIQDALNYMNTSGLPSDRMLYVEGGTYDGFDVNGFSDPWLALLNGVIGVDGSDNTFINSDINITNITDGFILRGLTLDTGGLIYADNNSGTFSLADIVVENSTDTGIQVTNHSGPVEFNGVNASNNSDNGAFIDNTLSSEPVTIRNSAFNDNGMPDTGNPWAGTIINSNNTVTLSGVAACGNNGAGIDIWEYGTLNISDSFINNNFSSLGGWGYALRAYTSGTGTATLENVRAYGNKDGIDIYGGSLKAMYIEVNDSTDGTGFYFDSDVGSSRIDFGWFNNNFYDGLNLRNKGAIYLNCVQANNNGGNGAYLDNEYYDYGDGVYIGNGPVTVTSPSGGFYFNTANSFFDNGGGGITIVSRGSVKLSNFDSGGNGNWGVVVDNTEGNGSVTIDENLNGWANGVFNNVSGGINIYSNGNVKVFGTQVQFNDNSSGLYLINLGTIELKDFTAESNDFFGAYLDNSGSDKPKTVKFTNARFDHNENGGVYVLTKGNISANGLTASGNSLRNTVMGDVTNVRTYNDLIGAGYIEDIFTFGAIAGQGVNLNLESDDFDTYLVLVDPDGLVEEENDDGGGGTNSLISRTLNKSGTYTVIVKSVDSIGYGWYNFSLNDPGHTNVYSYSYMGALLDNSPGNGGVTVNKPKSRDMWGNIFDFNTSYGLFVDSNGNIKIDSTAASANRYSGLWLNNPDSHASVQVINSRKDDFSSEFNRNGGSGAFIQTLGNITLKNINASENDGDGFYVDNCQYNGVTFLCDGFGGVKVLANSNWSNSFNYNDSYGLNINSKGSVTLANIYAEGNTWNGASVSNCVSGASGSVKVSTSGKDGWNEFYGNQYGLAVCSNGTINVNKASAGGNWVYGISLDNTYSSSSPAINITSAYVDNNETGMNINSNGNITWKYGAAWSNESGGVQLSNLLGSGNITVKGKKNESIWLNENGWAGNNTGLNINSKGSISIQYVEAYNNGGYGVNAVNNSAATSKNISISDLRADGNFYSGLLLQSKGSIAIKGIQSTNNGQNGAWVKNDYTGGDGNVIVTTSNTIKENIFNDNQMFSGLYISSAGNVLVSNSHASGNNTFGIQILNTSGNGSVTYQTNSKDPFHINGNGATGLYIESHGTIRIRNKSLMMASGNGANGLFVSNEGSASAVPITIENVASDNNNGEGMFVRSNGDIELKNISSSGNQASGADIRSNNSSIEVGGENAFANNNLYGITINAYNSVTISNTFAGANGFEGIDAYSQNSGNIKVTNATVAHNRGTGIRLGTVGSFYLDKVSAYLNGQDDDPNFDDGLYINAGVLSMVTIKNSTFMTNWWGSGIEIYHPDAFFWPSLSNVNYLSNGGPDIYVHN